MTKKQFIAELIDAIEQLKKDHYPEAINVGINTTIILLKQNEHVMLERMDEIEDIQIREVD